MCVCKIVLFFFYLVSDKNTYFNVILQIFVDDHSVHVVLSVFLATCTDFDCIRLMSGYLENKINVFVIRHYRNIILFYINIIIIIKMLVSLFGVLCLCSV